jgi:hypothetical protein
MSAAGGPRALPPAASPGNARTAAALEDLSRRARQAGRQLWLASLGAAASAAHAAAGAPRLAQRGRRLVDRLIERGRPLAERQAQRARARLGSITDRASRTVQSAADLARETAEYETQRLLHRFELATADDLRLLALRLEALDQKLDDYRRRLAGTQG